MTHRKLLAAVSVSLALAVTSSARAAPLAPADASAQLAAVAGLDAEVIGAAELDAIHGALTGADIFNALLAKAMLIQDPVFRDKVVASLLANQTTLVSFFDRLLSFRR